MAELADMLRKLAGDEFEDFRGGTHSVPPVEESPADRRKLDLVRKLLKLTKTAADYATGLPSKKNYGNLELLNNLPPGTLIKYILQRHDAKKAKLHFDMRMGLPETDLYSWAIPKAQLPEPGEKKLAIRTPLHRYSYAQFEGKLKGYGAGTVSKADEGQVRITKARPDQINFETAHAPGSYTLKQTNGMNWLLINTGGRDGTESKGAVSAPTADLRRKLAAMKAAAAALQMEAGTGTLESNEE